MKAPRKEGEREENETERGLRVTDAGFLNTAVIASRITYIDGDAGSKSTIYPANLLSAPYCLAKLNLFTFPSPKIPWVPY